MPSGWDVYYVVFLSAALALGIPAGLTLVSAILRTQARAGYFRPSTPSTISESAAVREGKVAELGRRLNTRFFRGANVALLLIGAGLILVPCVGLFQPELISSGGSVRGLVGILSLSAFAALGLLYAARKGDLDWLKSFTGGDPK